MTDTWAKDYYDYPGAEVYSYKSGDLMKENTKRVSSLDTVTLIPLKYQSVTPSVTVCPTPISRSEPMTSK